MMKAVLLEELLKEKTTNLENKKKKIIWIQ